MLASVNAACGEKKSQQPRSGDLAPAEGTGGRLNGASQRKTLPFEPLFSLKEFDAFDLGTATELSEEEVLDLLRTTEDLYAEFPEDTSAPQEESCESKRADRSGSVELKDKETLIIRVNRSGDLCPGETESKNEAVVMMRCDGGDLSRFKDVKSAGEFEGLFKNGDPDDLCRSSKGLEGFLNVRGSYKWSGSGSVIETEYRRASLASDGGSCRWARKDQTLELETDCLDLSLSQSSGSSWSGIGATTETANILRLKSKPGLVQRLLSKDPWFESGVIEVVANNWSGTVTYRGSSKPPRLVLTNRDKTKTIDQELQPFSPSGSL